MAFDWMSSSAASVLPLVGIVLALANWNVRPDAARAWTVAVVVCLIMVAVRQGFQLVFRHALTFTQCMKRMFSTSNAHRPSGGNADAASRQDADVDVVRAALAETIAMVNNGVVFGALMVIIPLAMSLAHAYGVVDDPKSGSRASMIICGAYLVLMGNGMPRTLGPITSTPRVDARIQAFHRAAGWTWVLCGLAFVTASLALPISTAARVSMALVGTAMIVTVVQFLRLIRAVRQRGPRLN